MGKASRDKGARGERELFRILTEALGVEIRRNLRQYQRADHDQIGLDGYAIEVKRAENLSLGLWWQQALQQASNGEVPVLAYRKSRMPWRFRVPLGWACDIVITSSCGCSEIPIAGPWVETDLDGFVSLVSARSDLEG